VSFTALKWSRVEHREAQRGAVPAREADLLPQALVEQLPVAELGQRIDAGALLGVGQLVLELALDLPVLDASERLRDQHRPGERLGEVIDRAQARARHHRRLVVGVGREQDHRDQLQRLVCLHRLEHVEPAHARHHHVQDDQIDPVRVGADHLQRGRAVRRLEAPDRGPVQPAHDEAARVRIVIDDEDRPGALRCPRAFAHAPGSIPASDRAHLPLNVGRSRRLVSSAR
jgi:hypothetical protein